MDDVEKRRRYAREWAQRKYQSDPAFRAKARERKRVYLSTAKGRAVTRAYSKEYVKSHPDLYRNASFKRHHGIAREIADAMASAQGNRCLICHKEPSGKGHCGRLHVDHDHGTGKIRGMICHRCNLCLGFVRDDPSVLRAIADYLDKHI